MRHAGEAALDRLEPLLVRLRATGVFQERARGVFHRKSRAALHFHEDPSGLYADLRLAGDDFERIKVDEAAAQDRLVNGVEGAVAAERS